MGNLLAHNRTAAQQAAFGIQTASSIAIANSFVTVAAQYSVYRWGLASCVKNSSSSAPVAIAAAINFWALYALDFNAHVFGAMAPGDPLPLLYYVATPLLAFGGALVMLIASVVWTGFFNWAAAVPTPASNDGLEEPLLDDGTAPLEGDASSWQGQEAEEGRADVVADDDALEPAAVPAPAAPPPQNNKKAKVHYINNIKIFLTVMVIIYHCYTPLPAVATWGLANPTNWGVIVLDLFIQLNFCYFMEAFFFYSGYFVPKSLDKKGRHDFWYERAKRLGIPFVAYLYIIGPYIENGISHWLFGSPQQFPAGTTKAGPCWFLAVLMIFSSAYAIICGEKWSPTIPCPSLLGFFFIGVVFGILASLVILFMGQVFFFFGTVAFPTNLIPYTTYFWGGALAQRNGWMEDIKEKSRVAIYGWAFVAFTALTTYVTLELVGTIPSFMTLPPAASAFVAGLFLKGIVSVPIFLAVTVFFQDYGDRTYGMTPFFSKAMYTAYIIHQPIIPVAFKCVVLIYEKAGAVVDNVLTNPNLIFPGWLLTCAVALAITWPVAYAIASIPGFNRVL